MLVFHSLVCPSFMSNIIGRKDFHPSVQHRKNGKTIRRSTNLLYTNVNEYDAIVVHFSSESHTRIVSDKQMKIVLH